MPNLYVTEQGAVMRKQGGEIIVEKTGETLFRSPLKDVDLAVCFGNVQVTTQAMFALLDQGADIAFLTRNGHFKGKVLAAKSRNVALRVLQHRRADDDTFRLAVAQELMRAKLRGGISLLKRYKRSAHNPAELARLKEMNLYLARIGEVDNIDSLRGVEGAGTRLYWDGFRQCLTGGRLFEGRRYHPSPDPINALLSFGYSFTAREMQGVLESVGLDPYVGFYHTVSYGRASLSLDLIEPFRHMFIDALVLRLFNKRVLTEGDFYRDEASGGFYLQKPSIHKFVRHYEQAADEANRSYGDQERLNFRRVMWEVGGRLRKAVEGKAAFELDLRGV